MPRNGYPFFMGTGGMAHLGSIMPLPARIWAFGMGLILSHLGQCPHPDSVAQARLMPGPFNILEIKAQKINKNFSDKSLHNSDSDSIFALSIHN